MPIHTVNLEKTQKLEKKSFETLSKPANNHGLSLISTIAFLSLAIISSGVALPSIVTYSALSISVLSSVLTYRFYKILQNKISNIIDEKNTLNIQNWDIKRANIFSYYTLESTYKL
ncbi:MAG: hypothetical protein K1060chlam4_00794 [Candidatus Anoxychlamydiales bacterium]|nr:hypothetical protein [Candidatus Anoxychlamydiales bacterium]